MQTTRTTHLMRRVLGLAAVPALVFTMAACGDDEESGGSSGGDSGGGDSTSFCDDARELQEAGNNMDEEDPGAIEDALTDLQNLDPPAEIADEWDLLFSSEAVAFDENGQPSEEYAAASEAVGTYMEEECGLTE
jgi:hypothetical protein